jgi:hypothetical protein
MKRYGLNGLLKCLGGTKLAIARRKSKRILTVFLNREGHDITVSDFH